jgi:hypothetical protein
MIFSTTAAYAIYPMAVEIDEIIDALNSAGCRDEDLCLLLTPTHRLAKAVRDTRVATKVLNSDPPTSGLLQWLSRFGAVIVPGLAFFVSSRVFLRAVLAPCPANHNSAYADSLIGLGLPPQDADRYGHRLGLDSIMVFVCCSGAARAHWIREILRTTGAEEAVCLQEAVGTGYAVDLESPLLAVT